MQRKVASKSFHRGGWSQSVVAVLLGAAGPTRQLVRRSGPCWRFCSATPGTKPTPWLVPVTESAPETQPTMHHPRTTQCLPLAA